MRDLISKLLGRSALNQLAKLPPVSVALFGKHRAWGDHIDNLGDESQFLLGARNLLYGEGLNRQIGSGAWEKLSPDQRLPGFDHFFVWYFGGRMLTGLFWSSSDSHGRTQYPLVIVVETQRRHEQAYVRSLLEAMLRAKQTCVEATDQAAVRRAVDDLRDTLLRTAPREQADTIEFSISPGFQLRGDDVPRVLHELRNGAAHLSHKAWSPERDPEGAVALRVPLVETDRCDLLDWISLVGCHLHPSVSLLGFAARHEGMGDLLLGSPNAQNFFCIRASLKSLPFTTEIPYEIAAGLRDYATSLVTGLKQGQLPARTIFGDVPTQKSSWMGVGSLLKG